MFEIEADRFNAMLITKGTGVWTVQTAREFLAAEGALIADLGVPVSDLLILFDASEFSVQDETVLHLLRNPANPLYHARRGAFVTPPGFGMGQIRKGTPQPHIGIFETLSEAWQYLRAA